MPLTVIGERLARKGVTFTYAGETDEGCAPCKLRKVCHGLERNRRYEIADVRKVKHDVCHVFDGLVQVVEAKPLPHLVNVPSTILKGTMFTRKFEECGVALCPERARCAPAGVPEGARAEILQVGAKIACPAGRDLRAVTAETGPRNR